MFLTLFQHVREVLAVAYIAVCAQAARQHVDFVHAGLRILLLLLGLYQNSVVRIAVVAAERGYLLP